MNAADVAYDLAVAVARTAAPLAGGTSKLSHSLRGRQEAEGRLGSWAIEARDRSRLLVWAHAPSVGEGLQARAVLAELENLLPALQTVFTHTSPSALQFARSIDVDVADYLPWDAGRAFERLFDALRPDLVMFTQREVWPGLARAAHARDVPTALVAATLPPGARRLRRAARWALRPTFGRLASVHAIAEADGHRFEDLGVPSERVMVTGDPAIDSAWERARAADPTSPHLRPFTSDPAPTLVAGSTWPADEDVLLPAAGWIREAVPTLRLVIVPHEPTEEAVGRLCSRLGEQGWDHQRLSTLIREGSLLGAAAVVVDSVGFLADLYTVGSVALVGGAFDDTGIHSVLEPAAAGLPVVFGPYHGGSRAASDLIGVGGARAVRDANALAAAVEPWLQDLRRLNAAAREARDYVAEHRGAAGRSARALEKLVARGPRGNRWNAGREGA